MCGDVAQMHVVCPNRQCSDGTFKWYRIGHVPTPTLTLSLSVTLTLLRYGYCTVWRSAFLIGKVPLLVVLSTLPAAFSRRAAAFSGLGLGLFGLLPGLWGSSLDVLGPTL